MQNAKFVDLTRTYLPIDPYAFFETMHGASKEDSPENRVPVMAYEGYNFLPTSYGYKSFFGTNAKFDIPEIPTGINVDKIFVVGTDIYTNYFIMLADTGIYSNTGAEDAEWIHEITIDAPVLPIHEEWTVAVIGNSLFMYRAKEPSYWRIDASDPGVVAAVVPSFLNMEGQRGIFKAGGRLGFWDSLGSVSYASVDSNADFEPSLETLAGNMIFNEVTGNIVVILSMGEGFVIYATHSIVQISQNLSQSFQWDPKVLLNNAGPAYMGQVCSASPDTMQFALTSLGVHKVEGGKAELVIPEVTDLLKESIYPIFLQFVENRYLCFKIIESKFIEGQVEQYSVTYQGPSYVFPTDLSLALAESLEEDYRMALLSLGRFKEQQELARLALIAAGIEDAKEGYFLTPVWQWALNRRDEVVMAAPPPPLAIYEGEPVTAEKETTYCNGAVGTTSTFNYAVRSMPTTVFPSSPETEGKDAISGFISAQRTAWQDDGIAHREKLFSDFHYNGTFSDTVAPLPFAFALTDATVPFANAGTTWTDGCPANTFPTHAMGCVLTDYTDALFTYTACSVRAQATYTKAAHRKVFSSLPGSSAGSANFLPWIDETNSILPVLPLNQNVIITSYARITKWRYVKNDGTLGTIAAAVCSSEEDGSVEDAQPYIIPEPLPPNYNPWIVDPLDFPDITINLQNGSPGPAYPTFAGMWVYDLPYKKWGKSKGDFKQLLDLSPINTNQGAIVTTARFGINSAVLKADKFIWRHDMRPTDSKIKYGKIGYYRLGFTTAEEVKAQFRLPCTGTIQIEGSLDGKNPEAALVVSENYAAVTSLTVYPAMSARWHSITFKGIFDLDYLEYRGVSNRGRR